MGQLQFGAALPLFACPGISLFRTPNMAELDPAAVMQFGIAADRLGFDSLWAADHLMLGKDEEILEGWTVLAALAGATTQAKLGMIHMSTFFRPPAIIAKMAATLDLISNGRLIHFLDIGHLRRESLAYGLNWDDDPEGRIADLAESMELVLKLWTSEAPVTMQGRLFSVTNAVCTPPPVQRPHPPIWFGEDFPGILRLCAKYGQGWNTVPVSLEVLRSRLAALRSACEAEGRDVNEIEISLETQVLIATDLDALRAQLRRLLELADGKTYMPNETWSNLPAYHTDPEMQAFLSGATDVLPRQLREEWIVGTPDMVANRITAYADEGVDHFVMWFMDAPDTAGIDLFAREVTPRFR